MLRAGVAVVVLATAIAARSARADDRILVVGESELVVSERHGRWGVAREAAYMFPSLGFTVRRIPRARGGQDVAARTSTETPTIRDDASDASLSYTERFGVAMSRASYVGVEAELGLTALGELEPGTRTFGAGGMAVVGLHGGSRLIKLGIELAGGGRLVEIEGGSDGLTGELVLEARARGDLWLTPWVTIGAAVGTSVITRGEWLTGIHLGFHTHSFGGP